VNPPASRPPVERPRSRRLSAPEIAAGIAERAAWRYSRSSGPGGQRRDHAETRAELTVTAADLEGLP
jgi:ribosome-associated protein